MRTTTKWRSEADSRDYCAGRAEYYGLAGTLSQAEVTRLGDDVEHLHDQVDTVGDGDATGNLDEPPMPEAALGSSRAGCVRPTMAEIRIANGSNFNPECRVWHGTRRSVACADDTPIPGLAVQLQSAGRRDVYDRSLCGRRSIGRISLLLRSVHLTMMTDLAISALGLKGECRADDFPEMGDKTILEWEQSIQNFVISDVQ